jgi:predicted NBD/HSP70 family sugar kinase
MQIAGGCAALINNLAMTFGGVAIEIRCTREALVVPALQKVETLYPQVRQVLSEYSGVSVTLSHIPGRPTHETTPHTIRTGKPQAVPPVGITAVGVNIGQTMTKFAAIRDGVEREDTRTIVPTWLGNPERLFSKLLESTLLELERFLSRYCPGGDVEALGISIGGIVRDGYVVSRSGIASRMSLEDLHGLRNLAHTVTSRLGIPTIVVQDVVAKAHAIRARGSHARTLVLDLGTSIGGAFIAADSTIPDYLNQVGRIVVDVSEDAVPRDDGQAVGVLSKYLSLSGYSRLREQCDLDDFAPDEVGRLAFRNDARARCLVKRLTDTFVDAIALLNRYYRARIVVLTGGLISSALGSALVREVIGRPSYNGPGIAISANPLFEAASGAALMAAQGTRPVPRW